MKLYCKQYSDAGEPLVVLHGLFGNQANWAWHARELAGEFSVHALDLRNHGRSPWSGEHDYAAMAADLEETLADLGLEAVNLLGHSMGGKAAMQFAFRAPERVRRLLLVDIAPVAYPDEPFAPLEGLLAIPLERLDSRRQADEILAAYVGEKPVRDFLLTNLQRGESRNYTWRCNLRALADNWAAIRGRPEPMGRYEGPVLFIKGGRSDYLLPEHEEAVRRAFPAAVLKVVEGAGHWVHSEKPQAFLKLARDFLTGS